MEQQKPRIGFIGLGQMGQPMSRHIMEAGYPLVVNDLRREAAAPLLEEGARWADTPREVTAQSDIVCTSVPGPHDMEEVCLGDDGILAAAHPGLTYVDMTTNYPSVVRQVAATLAERGIDMVDAPVVGGAIGAQTGRLTAYVGGSAEVFQRVKPVLECVGDTVMHVGDIGCGTICKLVANSVAFTARQVLAECFTMAVKAGMDPLTLWQAMKESSYGRQAMLGGDQPSAWYTGDFEVRFRLALGLKDIGLTTALAREYQVPMRMVNTLEQELMEAMNRGLGDEDNATLWLLQEERAGQRARIERGEEG